MMRRQITLIGCFLSLLMVPLIGYLFDDRGDISAAENRTLAPKPDWPRSIEDIQSLPKKFESALNDRFGLRERLTDLHHGLKLLLGDSPVTSVILGKQGWLFLNGAKYYDPAGDMRGTNPLGADQLHDWAVCLQTRRDWLAARGIAFIFMIAPNKHGIYPEYLPDYYTRIGRQTPADQLQEYLARHTSVIVADAKAALLAQKNEGGHRLYWQTDTHWNHYGGYIAYRQLENILVRLFPDEMAPTAYTDADFEWSTHKGFYLARMIGIDDRVVDDYPRLKTLTPAQFSGDTAWDAANGTMISRNSARSGTALIFRDSFFTMLQEYVADAFGTVIFIWRRPTIEELRQQTLRYHPDVVVEETVERALKIIPPVTAGERQAYFTQRVKQADGPVFRLEPKDDGHLAGSYQIEPNAVRLFTVLKAAGSDPHFVLKNLPLQNGRRHVLKMVITAPVSTTCQIFFDSDARLEHPFQENNSLRVAIEAGPNEVLAIVPYPEQGRRLRIDLGDQPGEYVIESLEIFEFDG